MIGNMKYGTDCTDRGVPLKCNPAMLSVLKANSIGFQLERVTQACPYLAAVQVI